MAGGFFRDLKIAACISGTRGLLHCNLCYRGIKTPVSAFHLYVMLDLAPDEDVILLSVISLDINPLGGMLATGSGDYTARICQSLVYLCVRLLIFFDRVVFASLILPCLFFICIHLSIASLQHIPRLAYILVSASCNMCLITIGLNVSLLFCILFFVVDSNSSASVSAHVYHISLAFSYHTYHSQVIQHINTNHDNLTTKLPALKIKVNDDGDQFLFHLLLCTILDWHREA